MRRYLVQVRRCLPARAKSTRYELTQTLVQDAQFLDGFVALLGAAVACSDATASRIWLGKQLGFICSGASIC